MPDTTFLPGASAPMSTTAELKPKRWLRWAIPLLAFALGVGLGGAGGESDVEASPAYMTLRSELTDTQKEADELADQVTEAESRIQRATEDGEARLALRTTELDGRSAQLDQREQELVVREAEAVQAPPVAMRPTTAASGASQPTPASPVPAAPAPQAPASTSYQNCDAVRAAGAAPIRVGDAGYAGHLDRDGDGVGCE